jgi:hypothetical protein
MPVKELVITYKIPEPKADGRCSPSCPLYDDNEKDYKCFCDLGLGTYMYDPNDNPVNKHMFPEDILTPGPRCPQYR